MQFLAEAMGTAQLICGWYSSERIESMALAPIDRQTDEKVILLSQQISTDFTENSNCSLGLPGITYHKSGPHHVQGG